MTIYSPGRRNGKNSAGRVILKNRRSISMAVKSKNYNFIAMTQRRRENSHYFQNTFLRVSASLRRIKRTSMLVLGKKIAPPGRGYFFILKFITWQDQSVKPAPAPASNPRADRRYPPDPGRAGPGCPTCRSSCGNPRDSRRRTSSTSGSPGSRCRRGSG